MGSSGSIPTTRRLTALASRNAGLIKVVAVAVIALGMMLILRRRPLGPTIEALQGVIRGLGPWGPVAFGVLYVLAVIALVPGSALTLAAGAVRPRRRDDHRLHRLDRRRGPGLLDRPLPGARHGCEDGQEGPQVRRDRPGHPSERLEDHRAPATVPSRPVQSSKLPVRADQCTLLASHPRELDHDVARHVPVRVPGTRRPSGPRGCLERKSSDPDVGRVGRGCRRPDGDRRGQRVRDPPSPQRVAAEHRDWTAAGEPGGIGG